MNLTKKEIEDSWENLGKIDFRKTPYEIKDEQEALEIAEVAVGFGINDPEQALKDNRTIKQWYTNKFNQLSDIEYQEQNIDREIEEIKQRKSEREQQKQYKLQAIEEEKKRQRQERKEESEKEKLKRLAGLEKDENVEKLRGHIWETKYIQGLKKELGLGEYDKEVIKQKAQEKAKELREEEEWEREYKESGQEERDKAIADKIVDEWKASDEYKNLPRK